MKKTTVFITALLTFVFFVPTCYAQTTNVIFEDNFDNYQNWSSSLVYGKEEVWPDTIQTVLGGPGSTAKSPDWYSYRVAPISNLSGKPLYVVDGTDIHGTGGKSLKYNLENNSYMNGGGMDLYLGGGKTGGYEEIYIRTYMKLEPGFDFQNGGSQFIKLFRLYTGVDPDTDDLGPSSTFATNEDYDATPKIKRSMNAYLDIVSDGNEDQRLKLAYFLGQKDGVDYIENPKVFPAATFNFKDHLGEWIYVEWYAKLNTIGQSDGEMKVWIVPESNKSSVDQANPTASWTGLEIRSTSDRKFNAIIMADNMSGQWERVVKEQTISWDDLVVSTAFVGPDYVIGSSAPSWQQTLEQNFDIADTFDDLDDWGKTVSADAVSIQDYPDAFPEKADGSPSIWQYYYSQAPVGGEKWIKNHGPANVWRGTGKSMCIDYGNGVDGVWRGPGRMAFKIGDSPDDGYQNEVYVFFMTKWFKDFFKTTGDTFDYHRFLKTLDISAGFKTVRQFGTDVEYNWLISQNVKSQVLHEYGLNAQVYNYTSYNGGQIIKNTYLVTNSNGTHYDQTEYQMRDATMGQPVLQNEWFGLEYRVKTSNPHGASNGEFEVWVYDKSGNLIGHELTTGIVNFKDGSAPFNHRWNKFVWGGNRFAGAYCSNGDPLCNFGPVDHFYFDDVVIHGSRIGPKYFSLLNGTHPLKGDVNCDKVVDVLDVQALVNCILGTGNCDWGCGNSADVNKDDSIDVLDVQEVVNIILVPQESKKVEK